MTQNHVLTSRERNALLDRKVLGRKKIKVKAHVRIHYERYRRQQLKDKTVEEFALRFCSQLYRCGVTAQDRKHVSKLHRLLLDTMANAGKERGR